MAERRGRSLERLVEALEMLSSNGSDFRVESPAFLPDRDTGQSREIDVLLTHTIGNKVTRVAFECKDHSRPIDVPKIEAFASKCDSLEVDLRVLVSSSGFNSNCIPKAAAKNVLLHTIEKSVNFDWLRVAGLLEDIFVFTEFGVFDGQTGEQLLTSVVDERSKIIATGDYLDAVSVKLACDLKNVKCYSDKPFAPALATNSFSFVCENLTLPFPHKNAGKKVSIVVGGKYYFHRQYISFGYYSYRRTRDEMKFATVKSSLAVDDRIETLLAVDGAGSEITVLNGGNCGNSSSRVFRRLVSWENLADRLVEVGPRHHLNVSLNSDTLTLTGFMDYLDEGSRDWDGVTDKLKDIESDGCCTVSFYERHKAYKTRLS